MNKETLKMLLKEAKKNAKLAEKKFEKYDNTDDMNEMDGWLQTITWLETKIKENNNE